MKKVTALILCFFTLMLAVSAESGLTPQEEHELEYVWEIPASCETDGAAAHYRCVKCGALFTNPRYEKQITDASELIIQAAGHEWGEWETVTEPTETEPGLRRRYCLHTDEPHVLVVTLDAGHGYYDNRGYYSEYYEGRRMYTLMSFLAEELEQYSNVVVYKTRNDIKDDMVLSERGKTAAGNGSELFISLHSNWYSSSSAMGVSVYRSFIRPESDELGTLLGLAVTDVINASTGETYMRNEGKPMLRTEPTYGPEFGDGVTQDYYNVTRESVVSEKCRYSYIIEHGFHSNPKECSFLLSDDNLRIIAKAEADVIADYFNLYPKGDEPVPERHFETEEIPPLSTVPLKGDVNGDGAVNNKDVMALFVYLSGSDAAVNEEMTDVNGDGHVNNKDVTYLFRYVSGTAPEEEGDE